ncbi:hypothetical protein D9623_33800 (plasmid) [Azospirillum brasilense]|nr:MULTISPECIES: hypothetical protein [Azospirillum]YP_001686848.1 hypothetical protein APCd_gp07 [Azospirillum phage Cd]MDW7555415.1 hypothetical protein [Azospirillum brasilense]MDW7595177.1 hypothetical protein [Azospirillum brasilense]MDW7630330.1 hypothetical protein [Azospirillum brasilense]MDX5949698.1 hypothetical protein [Azospirillum brasilense]OPH16832.1 hypothetical protein FE89_02410 [Azospirillum brasilense]
MGISKKRDAVRAALYVEIQKLYDRGLNSKEIGDALRMSAVQAASNMSRMGLEARPPEKVNKASVKKPSKDETPEPVKLMTKAEIAAAAGWRPLGNRDRVTLEMDISKALAAVRQDPSDEEAKTRLRVLIAKRDSDDCARDAVRVAA